MAAIVPARRALSWQLTDTNGTGVVRERYWITFQPGEIYGVRVMEGFSSEELVQLVEKGYEAWNSGVGATLYFGNGMAYGYTLGRNMAAAKAASGYNWLVNDLLCQMRVIQMKTLFEILAAILCLAVSAPALAADVGSLKDEIIEGKTGFVFRPEDSVDLAAAIEKYFASDLYRDLSRRRKEIRDYATERNNWDVVGQMTMNVYADLLRKRT